jgi:putative flippase GtrA
VHTQLVKALSGQGSGSLTVSNGQVVANLGPFIDVVKKDLAARGFTLVNNIPAINPTVGLFSAKYLVKAQTGYRVLNDLKIVLPILALVLLAAGIYIARSHRRALIGAGLGFAASMLVLGIALAIARSIYLNSVPNSVLPANAAAVLFDTLVRFIKDGLRTLLVVGLIAAIAAFFSGPSVTAVRARGTVKGALGWLRSSGERAGLRTGPVGRWTFQHRRALRIGAVALFALIFVFWGRPTAAVVIVLAILLLVVLGLIELIGRPPVSAAARPQATGPDGG